MTRLALPFESLSPEIDESPLGNETPKQLVTRLAEAKARKISAQHPKALIIGCDQIAVAKDKVLTKPITHDVAVTQLLTVSGQSVTFLTGLCLLDAACDTVQTERLSNTVHFRRLQLDEIERYLKQETPYDCAGSFKSEGYAITLVHRIDSEDPTSLMGLPLISLTRMLRNVGVALP